MGYFSPVTKMKAPSISVSDQLIVSKKPDPLIHQKLSIAWSKNLFSIPDSDFNEETEFFINESKEKIQKREQKKQPLEKNYLESYRIQGNKIVPKDQPLKKLTPAAAIKNVKHDLGGQISQSVSVHMTHLQQLARRRGWHQWLRSI